MTSSIKAILLFGLFCGTNVVLIFCVYTPYIELQDGSSIRGLVDDTYQSFLGIPYAEPPLGYLRFANPVPSRWYEKIDAVKNPEMCIQTNLLVPNSTVMGSEDCLYLNIYRPNVEYNKDTKLDVMVYIHGGGFVTGSIDPSITGPKYFMEQKSVILVMMQYRLSVLGFLSTGDRHSPGNFGLKDQALALNWVKDNIERFGGNQDSITIFGHGSGAASVQMHMLSPLSRGLFNKAIAMSGSAIAPYNYPISTNPIDRVRKQAWAVGINNVYSLNSPELVEKLRAAEVNYLVSSVARLTHRNVDPVTFYGTVVEPNMRDAFLIKDPGTMLQRGDFAKVPFMTGVVDIEGLARAAAVINATLLEYEPYASMLPKELEINVTGQKRSNFMSMLENRYFNGRSIINKSNYKNFVQIHTDYLFYYPLYKSLAYMINSIPVYVYKFSYQGQYSYSLFYTHNSADYGVVHGDDLIYLFDSPALFTEGLDKNDRMASQNLVQTFTAFAKNESPPKHDLQRCNAKDMNPMCKFTQFYKNASGLIDTKRSSQFDEEMIRFWDELCDLNASPNFVCGKDPVLEEISRLVNRLTEKEEL